MDLNITLLSDTFDIYYKKGIEAQNSGNLVLAKRNFLLAAETMMKLAKISEGQLKQVRLERAKRLLNISENLELKKEVKKTNCDDAVAFAKSANKDADGEDTLTMWKSATIPDIHFSDIAGLEDVKKAVNIRMINPFLHPDKYKAFSKKSGGGVLLFGPPGTGKTMIAKAIACEVGAKFYAVKCSDVVSKWVGESEKNINALFETARNDEKSIIFFDELEGLVSARGVDTHNDKRVAELLTQIDGFVGCNPNLLLLGATNRPWDVDEAARRPGRFSQLIFVPLPDSAARKFLFIKQLKNVPAENLDIESLVKMSDGYSGADIEEICERAKEEPLLRSIESDSIVPLTQKDFLYAFSIVRPSVSKESLEGFYKFANITQNTDKKI